MKLDNIQDYIKSAEAVRIVRVDGIPLRVGRSEAISTAMNYNYDAVEDVACIGCTKWELHEKLGASYTDGTTMSCSLVYGGVLVRPIEDLKGHYYRRPNYATYSWITDGRSGCPIKVFDLTLEDKNAGTSTLVDPGPIEVRMPFITTQECCDDRDASAAYDVHALSVPFSVVDKKYPNLPATSVSLHLILHTAPKLKRPKKTRRRR